MIKIDTTKIKNMELDKARAGRKSAFALEADPLFFKVQRGEATLEEWENKIKEIRERFPYPD